MSSRQPHAIQQLRFELASDSAALAPRLQDRVSSLYRHELENLLAEELGRHCPPDVLLTLPELKLDLGAIADSQLEAELPRRLRQALYAALGTELQRQASPTAAGGEQAAGPLSVVAFFLAHGYLPWQTDASAFSLTDAVLLALNQTPVEFRGLLRRLGQQQAVRQRLVRQLSPALLQRIIGLLEPTHALLIEAYIQETTRAQQQQRLAPVRDADLQQIVYELVLTDLLISRSTQFNRRTFIESQVRRLAAHFNLSFEALLHRLVVLSQKPLPFSAQSSLPGILRGIYQDVAAKTRRGATPPRQELPTGPTPGPPIQEPAAEPPATASPLELLVYFLRHQSLPYSAGAHYSATDLQASFRAVLQQGWAAVVNVVQQAGIQPAAATLARRFPASLLEQLVRQAVPGQVRPFLAVLAEHRTTPITWQWPARARHELLWEKSLPYLLPRRPVPFNSQHFSRWLTQQLAGDGFANEFGADEQSATFGVNGVSSESLESVGRVSAGASAPGRAASPRAGVAAGPGDTRPHQRATEPRLPAPAQLVLAADQLASKPFSASKLSGNQEHYNQLPAPLAATAENQSSAAVPFTAQPQSAAAQSSVDHSAAAAEAEQPATHSSEPLSSGSAPAAVTAPGNSAADLPRGQQLAAGAEVDLRTAISWPATATTLPTTTTVRPDPVTAAVSSSAAAGLSTVPNAAPAAETASAAPVSAVSVAAGRATLGSMPRSLATAPGSCPDAALPNLAAWLNASAHHAPAQPPLREWPAPAGREMVRHYLRVGSPALTAARLSVPQVQQLLAQLIAQRDAETLRLLQTYPTQALRQRRLSALLDFDLLRRLHHALPAPTSQPRQQWESVAKVFGTRNPNTAGPVTPRLRQLVLAAYYRFTFTNHRLSVRGQQREVRQMAAALNLAWPTVLRTMRQLAGPHSGLHREPLFAQLFLPAAPVTEPVGVARRTGYRSVFKDSRPGSGTGASRPRVVAPAAVGSTSAAALSSGASYEPRAAATTAAPRLPNAVQDLVLHFLRHGQLPWWQTSPVTLQELRQHLAQLLRRQGAQVRSFLTSHAAEAAVRQRLVQVADFASLTQLTTATAASAGRGAGIRRALLALERATPHPSQYAAGQFRLFLKEAYLLFHFSLAQSAATPALGAVRQLATSYGLPWQSLLRQVNALSQHQPTLATEPFFAWLLGAHEAEEQRRHNRRPRLPNRRVTAARPASAPTRPTPYSPLYEALEHYLQTGKLPAAGTGPGAALSLPAIWTELLQPTNRVLLARVRPYLGLAVSRSRIASSVSAEQFFTLLGRLYPVHARLLAPVLRDWQQLAARGLVELGNSPTALWELVLTAIEATAAASFQTAQLLSRLLTAEAKLSSRHAAALARGASIAGVLLRQAGRAGLSFQSRLPALLQHLDTTTRLAARQQASAAAAAAPAEVAAEVPALATAYITNAGLVLLWPFLTMLFDRLGYLENRQFKSATEAYRAVHLLQFLATGAEGFPEYVLVLNKLLCGVQQTSPVVRELALTAEEKETGLGLLQAVISRWEILKKTSVAGLQETFLNRNGRLDWQDDKILLTVETKAFDMLLDQRPWSIAVIRLPWMLLPLYVTWR
ncbi:contractile injection system tape measure protein [Hymenobacter chitinivorans]|uniref:Uncharacterized protein n=1 Tax=Hymenobacter chitinivorans DSM 11115 TaxID=1121954 RepID=A0A2M9BS58_9BACT|nr:contractile injection system tape measure protein [Hymenobacter chitinivorans]PJJ60786.1 hypothetical protein CLV45_2219 [Hymenobacter chitinivorans DSM 11115]